MKDETINKFTDKLLQYMQGAEDFLTSETPEYVKQLLEFSYWEATIDIILAWSIFLSFAVVFIMGRVLYKKGYGDVGMPVTIMGGTLGLFMLCLAPFVSADRFKIIMKIKTAPKVFIIDQLRK